jgi:hypothetical protein
MERKVLNVGPVVAHQVKSQAFRVVTTRETALRQDGAGAVVTGSRRLAGFQGRDTLVRADVFDSMEQAARARHAAKPEGAAFVPPFTPSQVMAARDYRALHERREAGSVRGCLASALPGSGALGRDAVDCGLDLARRVTAKRAAALAGDPVVISPRRGLDGGNGRRVIRLSDVFDGVVLMDRSLTDVLVGAGWAAKEQLRRELRNALRAALDRVAVV